MTSHFFGQVLDLRRWRPQPDHDQRSWRIPQIFARNLHGLTALAGAVSQVARAFRLDDYGIFRLHAFAIDHLTPQTSHNAPLCSVHHAVATGQWSPASRLLAIGALLRLSGYAAVPHVEGRQAVLYVPTADMVDHLNAHWRSVRWTLTVNGRAQDEYIFNWLLWDGVTPLGASEEHFEESSVLTPDEMIEGPRNALVFKQRQLPDFAKDRTSVSHLYLFESEAKLPYVHMHDLAKYLDYFPQFQFGVQSRLALQEFYAMRMNESVAATRRLRLGEVDTINLLLRTLQSNFQYVEGPLRPLLHIFEDRQGDCDQMSLVMAACLHALGYGEDDIVAMRWPSHLCLGVRPKQQAPPNPQASFTVQGLGKFYPLDATYYYYFNDKIASTWGMIDEEYRRSSFEIERLHWG